MAPILWAFILSLVVEATEGSLLYVILQSLHHIDVVSVFLLERGAVSLGHISGIVRTAQRGPGLSVCDAVRMQRDLELVGVIIYASIISDNCYYAPYIKTYSQLTRPLGLFYLSSPEIYVSHSIFHEQGADVTSQIGIRPIPVWDMSDTGIGGSLRKIGIPRRDPKSEYV